MLGRYINTDYSATLHARSLNKLDNYHTANGHLHFALHGSCNCQGLSSFSMTLLDLRIQQACVFLFVIFKYSSPYCCLLNRLLCLSSCLLRTQNSAQCAHGGSSSLRFATEQLSLETPENNSRFAPQDLQAGSSSSPNSLQVEIQDKTFDLKLKLRSKQT